MGYQTALGIAETDISLEQQLSWHFTTNCYPPVSTLMIPLAVEAIDLANEDLWDDYISCPEGVTYRGRTLVSASEVIEHLYLSAFITQEEE
jgi:hypothetical protein